MAPSRISSTFFFQVVLDEPVGAYGHSVEEEAFLMVDVHHHPRPGKPLPKLGEVVEDGTRPGKHLRLPPLDCEAGVGVHLSPELLECRDDHLLRAHGVQVIGPGLGHPAHPPQFGVQLPQGLVPAHAEVAGGLV